MNRYFVVCDEEPNYVTRFTELVNERRWMPYQIEGMTGTDGLRDFCSGHKVETLLIEEELYEDEMSKLPIGNIWLLSGQETAADRGDVRRVFKYQPVESIVTVILARETKVSLPAAATVSVQVPTKVIGIYSPVRRCQKTAFALALGQILAKEQKVIYLNYESLTGLHALLSGERAHDLADVLYLAARGKGHFTEWGEKWVRQAGGLDYLLPVLSPLDLMGAAEADFITVLEMVEREGGYQTIILEFDESCKAFLQLLVRCSVIYMPVGTDLFSTSQIAQYEHFLAEVGQSGVLEKTIRIKPPYYNGFGGKDQYVDQLVWGELGDYVRSLL